MAFLGDTNLQISNDAIRAIHDTHMEACPPRILAALLDDKSIGTPQRPVSLMILRRLIHSPPTGFPNEQNLLRVSSKPP
jgi:hypothetical protein